MLTNTSHLSSKGNVLFKRQFSQNGFIVNHSIEQPVLYNQKIIRNGTGGPAAAVGVHTNTKDLFGKILLLIESNNGTTSS